LSNRIHNKVDHYKKKFYLNLIIKGLVVLMTILLFVFLFYVLVEHQARFSSSVRSILFFSYVGMAVVLFYHFLLRHIIKYFSKPLQISDENAARNIGTFFPDIKDKLLNIIQLSRSEQRGNYLLTASIDQKSGEIGRFNFTDAIDLKENFQYVRWLAAPLIILLLLMLFNRSFITQPAQRIIQYKQEFAPQAPFRVNIENEALMAFKNEDYQLNVHVDGPSLPEDVFINIGDRRLKLKQASAHSFHHLFVKPQDDIAFKLEAAGFHFGPYRIETVSRPNIRNFDVELNYPAYLNKPLERFNNVGNFQVPEGTQIKWTFETIAAEKMGLTFPALGDTLSGTREDDGLYAFDKQLFQSSPYSIHLQNQYSDNKDKIMYRVEVIQDQYPKINFQQYLDTVLYNNVILGGNISDDYGLTGLRVYYRHKNQQATGTEQPFKSFSISIDREKLHQSFYHQWMLDSLQLQKGEAIEYYLAVRDNDGVNGVKTSRTGMYTIEIPSHEKIRETIEKSSQSTENQIDKSLEQALKLKKELEEAEEKLKGKRNLSWQDEKMLEGLLEQKKQLEDEIKKMQQQYDKLSKQNQQFDQKRQESIVEKVKQLDELMDEILDEETKKLYEELEKLLKENQNLNQINDVLEEINKKETNLEEELERTLELFKRLKYEQKLEQLSESFENMSEEQQDLSKKTLDKDKQRGDSNNEELMKDQQQLDQQLDDMKEGMDKLNEINQSLQHPNEVMDFEQEMKEMKQSMQESMEQLQQGKNKKASESQQKASDQMRQMSQKLSEMQSQMGMMSMQNNLGDLRYILENLTKLSSEQSTLMDKLRNVHQTDPKYLEHSQRQLHLKDYAKVIEDSLISLSNRAFQIKSFVTREVDDMNKGLDNSIEALRERKKDRAVGHQQHAMTSMNNLALMLDDVMSQMQQALADMMGRQQGKPKPNQGITMSQLQQQLNNRIKDLKNGQKQGRQLSEELAKLAAEQERLRRMLQEAKESMNPMQEGGGQKALEEIAEKMKETEKELVNKQLSEEMIRRQEDIQTRLLEHENAKRERELSKEREAEQAKQQYQEVPEVFEDYIRSKQQEIELLKTVPPKLNPYYKEEVNKYFNRLGNF